MTWVRRVFTAASILAVLVGRGRADAAAGHAPQSVTVTVTGPSGTTGPTPSPSPVTGCLQTRDAANHPQDTFPERGLMRVFLRAGCAEAHEVDIEIDIESSPVLFAHADADANGSFLTDPIRLPAPVLAGPHEVVAKTIDHTYRAPITVTAASVGGGGAGGGGGGTQVLGNVIQRVIPRTGAEIARMAVVGALLVGAGAVMIVLARRRRSHSRRNQLTST